MNAHWFDRNIWKFAEMKLIYHGLLKNIAKFGSSKFVQLNGCINCQIMYRVSIETPILNNRILKTMKFLDGILYKEDRTRDILM